MENQKVTEPPGCDDPVDLGPFLQNYVHKNPFGAQLLGGGIPSSTPMTSVSVVTGGVGSNCDRQQRDIDESCRVKQIERSGGSAIKTDKILREERGSDREEIGERAIISKVSQMYQCSKAMSVTLLKKMKISGYSKSGAKIWLSKTLKHRLRSGCRMRRAEVYDITKPMFPSLSLAEVHQCVVDLFPNVTVTSRSGLVYYHDLICKPEIFSGESEQLRAACERVLSYQLTPRQAAIRFSLSISSVLNAVAWYRAEQELLVSSLSNLQNTSAAPDVYEVDDCDDNYDKLIGEESSNVMSLTSSQQNVTSHVLSTGQYVNSKEDLYIVSSKLRPIRPKPSIQRHKLPISPTISSKRTLHPHQQPKITKRSRIEPSVNAASSRQCSEFAAEPGESSRNDRKCLERNLHNVVQQLPAAGTFSTSKSHSKAHHGDSRSDRTTTSDANSMSGCRATASGIIEDVDLEKMLQEAPCSQTHGGMQENSHDKMNDTTVQVKLSPSAENALTCPTPNPVNQAIDACSKYSNCNSNNANGVHRITSSYSNRVSNSNGEQRNKMCCSDIGPVTMEWSCNQNGLHVSHSSHNVACSSQAAEFADCFNNTTQIHETIVICPKSPSTDVSQNATTRNGKTCQRDDVLCTSQAEGIGNSLNRHDAIYTSALTSNQTDLISHSTTNGYNKIIDDNVTLNSNDRLEKNCRRMELVFKDSTIQQTAEANSPRLTDICIKTEPPSIGESCEMSNGSSAMPQCQQRDDFEKKHGISRLANHSNMQETLESIHDKNQLEQLLGLANLRNAELEKECATLRTDKQTLQENLKKSEQSLVKLSTAFCQLHKHFQEVSKQFQSAVTDIHSYLRMSNTSDENHPKNTLDQ